MEIKKEKPFQISPLRSDPAEARTQDPQIKSLLLYQLSYEVVFKLTGDKYSNCFNLYQHLIHHED